MPPTGPWCATASCTVVTGSGGSAWSGDATTMISPHSGCSAATMCAISGTPPNGSNAFAVPIRELRPPASTIPDGSTLPPAFAGLSTLAIRHIVRRGSAFEPLAELSERMRQAPLVENGARHRRRRTGELRRAARRRIRNQPRFERVGIRILLDGALEQRAFHTQAKRVGRLIALPLASPSLGRLECAEQRRAERRRPPRRARCAGGAHTEVASQGNPAPAGRW